MVCGFPPGWVSAAEVAGERGARSDQHRPAGGEVGGSPSSLSRGASSGDTPGTRVRVGRGSTLRTLPAGDGGGHLRSCPETLGVHMPKPAFLPQGTIQAPARARTARWKGRGQEQEAGGNKCLRAALGPPGDSGETRPRWGAGLHCLFRLRSTNSGTKLLRVSRRRPQSMEPRALTRCPGSRLGHGEGRRGLLC